MSGLMGDWACRPVAEKGVYAVYCKGDIDALKERNRRLKERYREVVHDNAMLEQKLNRIERGAS